jgi:UDP-N-acetylglucosamine--N-acetylmuramyl-(pentapeptide) pyrophosphoryl-undecaprenol N-acetylglucosamine transferase
VKRIVLTGGGTAGHVTPNISLLPALRVAGFDIHYIGTASGIEHSLISKENVPFHTIVAGKLRRYFDAKNITDLFHIAGGFIQSLLILLKLRPTIVFSKGGFVACPVVWSSWLLHIPAVIHESDITPGLANRLCLPFAYKICYSFPETAAHVKKEKAVYTGLPVRKELLEGTAEKGRALCGFTDNKPVVLVMGGSQGSVLVNKMVRDALPRLCVGFNVVHICGKGNKSEEHCRNGYAQFEYVTDELPHLFTCADIFVGRSGATTLFELLLLKKPSLLIPLSTGASRGDQILNAVSFERQGFCKVLNQNELTVETLVEGIESTYDRRWTIIGNMKKNAVPDGVASVMNVIEKVLKNTAGYRDEKLPEANRRNRRGWL